MDTGDGSVYDTRLTNADVFAVMRAFNASRDDIVALARTLDNEQVAF